MDLSTLINFPDSKQKRKRVGRGESSGLGKTSGKGSKGQKSRSGGGVRPGFEGGQIPIYKLVPKLRGFKSLNSDKPTVITLATLEKFAGEKVSLELLIEAGMLSKNIKQIKILASGEITRKIHVTAHSFSKTAKEKIEKLGGIAELVNG